MLNKVHWLVFNTPLLTLAALFRWRHVAYDATHVTVFHSNHNSDTWMIRSLYIRGLESFTSPARSERSEQRMKSAYVQCLG